MDTKGVYVGRFSPIHAGHESVIHAMLNQHGRKNCVVVIGSSNAPYSSRNIFSYRDRSQFIRRLFPTIDIIGLPDFLGDDDEWLYGLDELLNYGGIDPNLAIYYGGDINDRQTDIFLNAGRTCSVIDRNLTPELTATAVREALFASDWEKAASLLNPKIAGDVIRSAKWKIQTHSFDF